MAEHQLESKHSPDFSEGDVLSRERVIQEASNKRLELLTAAWQKERTKIPKKLRQKWDSSHDGFQQYCQWCYESSKKKNGPDTDNETYWKAAFTYILVNPFIFDISMIDLLKRFRYELRTYSTIFSPYEPKPGDIGVNIVNQDTLREIKETGLIGSGGKRRLCMSLNRLISAGPDQVALLFQTSDLAAAGYELIRAHEFDDEIIQEIRTPVAVSVDLAIATINTTDIPGNQKVKRHGILQAVSYYGDYFLASFPRIPTPSKPVMPIS